MRNENPTVYSTDLGRICPKCGKPLDRCSCKAGAVKAGNTGDGVVRIFRESKGRKGKTVTLIKGLPLNEEDLRSLLSDLKRMCGSGGSSKDGVLEIQGDHRENILSELKKRGYSPKIAGG
ncbi:MAG: translation initiation factor Sui1 [Anaerolineaceae bacterium]